MEIREITDNLTGRLEIHNDNHDEAMRLLQEMEKVIS
jgi:hypothetical protein